MLHPCKLVAYVVNLFMWDGVSQELANIWVQVESYLEELAIFQQLKRLRGRGRAAF
jgi:hypothetical protein